MHRTEATNHSSNLYVDESAPSAGDGTFIEAADRNAIQEELANPIEREQTLESEATDTDYDQLALAMGGRWLCGDGDDGDITTGGNVTLTDDIVCDTYTVSAGDTVTTAGYRILARKKITIEATGVIERNGNDGSGITAGAALSAGLTGASEDGGAGGPPGNGNGIAGDSTAIGAYGVGGDGGDGGDGGAGGNAGAGGSVTSPAASLGAYRAGGAGIELGHLFTEGSNPKLFGGAGGGGGAGDAGFGGGGGSGGGVLILIAPIIENNGEIQAKGGGGGDADVGGGGAGGGGGGGGCVIAITRTLAADLGTIDVSGGTGGGGASANDGVDGSDGETIVLSL